MFRFWKNDVAWRSCPACAAKKCIAGKGLAPLFFLLWVLEYGKYSKCCGAVKVCVVVPPQTLTLSFFQELVYLLSFPLETSRYALVASRFVAKWLLHQFESWHFLHCCKLINDFSVWKRILSTRANVLNLVIVSSWFNKPSSCRPIVA